jgi:ABC-type transport system involved in multi-copper enzyme maturation permease subunit
MFQDLGLMVFGPFALGVLLLSITPFGQELNWGTFSVLLSQPIPRPRLWLVKVEVVAVALGLAFLAFCISNHIRVDSALESMKHTVWRNAFDHPGEKTAYFAKLVADSRRSASQDTLLIGGLAVFAGFAGGLWTTLLFRQVTAAFWLTLLIPMGLTVVASNLLKNFPDAVARAGLALILGAYSAAGFLWAKRFFLTLQDTQWTGGVVSLPAWGKQVTERGPLMLPRKLKPLRALLRKEFQAQHVNLLLAGGLLLVHLGVVGFRRWSAEYLATHQSTAMALEMVPLLWLVMPLLIGSVAVAEERKLGTFQSNLCLPASRRIQFFAKLAIGVLLGIILGGIFPLLVEKLAPHNNVTGNTTGLAFLGDTRPIELLQLAGSIGLTLLAFYGSTLTRNALQAMGAGLSGAVVVCLVIFGAQHCGDSADFLLWTGPLVWLIGWPVMTLTIFLLAYQNYKSIQPDFSVWTRNGATLLAALVCVAFVTTTVYHRMWEAWLPDEPPHSFYDEFSVMGRQPLTEVARGRRAVCKLAASGSQKAVVLPDGRLWLQQRQARLIDQRFLHQEMVAWYETGPKYTGFADGSNWRDVAITQGSCFGIRADGTLWNISGAKPGSGLTQVGQDHDWETISAGHESFCALKSDGSLWQWGWRPAAPGPKLTAPVQVGTENDWAAVCVSWSQVAAVKSDGSVWRWRWRSRNPGLPEPWLTGACSEPVSFAFSEPVVASVCADGTLWIGGNLTNSAYARVVPEGLAQRAATEMVRWGSDSDWKVIRFVSWGKVVGIRRDGTLWLWDENRLFRPSSAWIVLPTMPSRFANWISVCEDDNAFLALARDGGAILMTAGMTIGTVTQIPTDY